MIDNITIKTIASGSTGNAYYISDGRTNILIEAGISFKKIQQAVDFKVSGLSGVLISHEHKDHSRCVKDIIKAGIDCYMSFGTAQALKLSGHRVKIIKALKQIKVGTFTMLPFDVTHDCEEPLGFLLASGDNKILYATDTPFIKYKFKGLTTIMIESNYQEDILQQNIASGICDPGLKARLLKTHLSLSNVIEFLKANDLSRVQEIFLLHLSSRNANPKQMKKAVEAEFGKPVFICGTSDHISEG